MTSTSWDRPNRPMGCYIDSASNSPRVVWWHFCTGRSFVKSRYDARLDPVFTFESELWAVILAIEHVKKFSSNFLLLEVDSLMWSIFWLSFFLQFPGI